MTDEKIIAIETTLSHHDRQIQDLSEIIAAQWKVIDRLKQRLDEALAKIEEGADGAPPASVKPPHY